MNEILNKLISSGYEAYVVGGYVRDVLLSRPSFDIDICTNAKIEEIEVLFKGLGKVYKEYYSYHIDDGIYSYEITTFRKELEYKYNKPIKLVPINDLYTDLLRRDFTINSFVLDINNNLIDLLNAKKDLDNKVIKVIGNAYERFMEDKTRILRAIKYASLLSFELDNEIKSFLIEKGHLLKELNPVYKKRELDIIFKENPIYFIDIINRYNLKEYIGIEYSEIKDTTDYYGIWAQIDCDFIFTKDEKYIINNIKKLVKNKKISNYDIYKYGSLICINASEILGIDIKSKINEIPINNVFDMDISYNELLKYKNRFDINKLFKVIERDIVMGVLNNNKYDIINFIEGEYHE